MSRISLLLLFLILLTGLVRETVAEETTTDHAITELRRLSARVVAYGNSPPPGIVAVPQRKSICISDSWTGGDDGLRFVERLFRDSPEGTVALHLFGSPKISAERMTALKKDNPKLPVSVHATPLLGVMLNQHAKGLLVPAVWIGAPADKAGVQKGDVLLSIGDVRLTNPQTVKELMRKKKAGQTVSIRLLRGENEHTVEAILNSNESWMFPSPTDQRTNQWAW